MSVATNTDYQNPNSAFELTQSKGTAWFVIGAGVLCCAGAPWLGIPLILGGLFMVIAPKPSVYVDHSGITLGRGSKQKLYPWASIKEFHVITTTIYFVLPIKRVVGFQCVKGSEAPTSFMTRTFMGNKCQLPQDLPIKAAKLAAILEMRRQLVASGYPVQSPTIQMQPSAPNQAPRQSNWSDGVAERYANEMNKNVGPTAVGQGFARTGLAPPTSGFGKRVTPFSGAQKKQWPEY
jgi:hypothetical protein